MASASAASRRGVMRKPLVEKLKIVALFGLLAALIYFSRPAQPAFGIGALLVTVGALIRVWAAGHLTRDQRLTTSGPYQFSRNPFYLGRLLLILGFGAMSGLGGKLNSPRTLIVWGILILALVVFFAFYMPRKEKREGGRLHQLFGPDYEKWKANVPSLFPRLTPFVMNPRPWSRELFMTGNDQFSGNKELWTTIATLALVALFYLRMTTQ